MKELSIEEKAKAYDKAIKEASAAYEDEDMHLKATLESIFPELKESEDERIRKEILAFINRKKSLGSVNSEELGKSNSWIAWLEKQGEQKPVIDIDIPFGAKDSELQEVTYYIPKGFHAEIEGNNIIIKKGEQKPTWSEEDENEYTHILKTLNLVAAEQETKGYNNLNSSINWLKSLRERVQTQTKYEWSEDDEKILSDIIKDLVHPWNEYIPDRIEDEIKWLKNRLKSIKDRILPQQEWSEDDEQMMNSFLHKVEVCNLLTNKENVWIINKLKALKPQNTWKPSDEQIEILDMVLTNESMDDNIARILRELREQLKKLKE